MWTQLPGEKRIALDDENLQYTGRIDFADPQNPVFLFTASFVRFRMTGHHLRVVLTNTRRSCRRPRARIGALSSMVTACRRGKSAK